MALSWKAGYLVGFRYGDVFVLLGGRVLEGKAGDRWDCCIAICPQSPIVTWNWNKAARLLSRATNTRE